MLVAASEGHTDVVSKLLREGADLQVKNIHDKTAIFLAAEENRVDTLKVCSIHFIAGLHAQPMLTLITIIYYTIMHFAVRVRESCHTRIIWRLGCLL